jgi:MSHA biogenesis protein MshQ
VNRNLLPPSGWTLMPNSDWTDGNNVRIRSYYKLAGPLEPPSYTFAFASGAGQDMSGGILAVIGARSTGPIDASNGQFNGTTSSKNVTAPSITTTVANTLLVFGGACNVIASFTPPAGMTEHWDASSSGTYKVSTEAASQALGPFGPTGVRIATASTSCRSLAVSIAVAPNLG